MFYHVHTAIVVSFVYGSLLSLSLQTAKCSTLNFLIVPSHMNSYYSEGVFKPITSYQGIAGREGVYCIPSIQEIKTI